MITRKNVKTWPVISLLLLVALCVTASGQTEFADANDVKDIADLSKGVQSPICNWEYDQVKARLAYNSQAGEFLVVWEDHHWGYGDNWDIYGRRVNNQGTPIGGYISISGVWNDAKKRRTPDVAYNSQANNYLVVWEFDYSATDHDVYAGLVAADGTIVTTDIPITTTGLFESNPVVAYNLANNEYLVVWEELHGDPEFPNNDLIGQRVGANGALLGGRMVIANDSVDEAAPAIAYSETAVNEYLVAWKEANSAPCVLPYHIKARRVAALAGPLGGKINISISTDKAQYNPRVAYNDNGYEYLVVWERYQSSWINDGDIFGRRVTTMGSLPAPEFSISSGGLENRLNPDVAYCSADNEYLVAWEFEYSPTDPDVYVRRVDPNGWPVDGEKVVSNLTSWEERPALAFGDGNKCLIVWEDGRGGMTTRMDIYGDFGAWWDKTPPDAEISSPSFHQCVCSIVDVRGVACDEDSGVIYELEYQLPGQPWTTICSSSTPVFPPGGTLCAWNTSGLTEGYYYLRLTVTNDAGLTSTTSIVVYVSRQFGKPRIRYPANGGIVGGSQVCIDGTVWDTCFDHYTVEYRQLPAGGWNPVPPGTYGTSVINDPFAHWNTTGLPYITQGYEIRVTGYDGCNITDVNTVQVIVDNTPPTAVITSPSNCANVPHGSIPINGTASDNHAVSSWVLQYTGGNVHGWVNIASGTTARTGLLGTWNTSNLPPCCYTLRLVVSDKARLDCGPYVHQSEYTVSVDVGAAGASADLNGDGCVDFNDFAIFSNQWLQGICPP